MNLHRPIRPGAHRVAALAALAASLLWVAAGSAPPAAQAQEGPDLNLLALDWARGRYASPLFCEIGGTPVRGLRRVLVTPGPRHARPPSGRIVFVKLEVEEAGRCFTELEGAVPNLSGQVEIRMPGKSRPDTAQRDFSAELRRRNGFEFDVSSGHLVVQEIGPEPGPARRMDFRGGHARMTLVSEGSDAARQLADLPAERRLSLELETSGGEILRLPLALTDRR